MLFITCQPSLEDVLADELAELGLSGEVGSAGCFVDDTWENIYTVNYASRLAGRVLRPMASFPFRSAEDFYHQAMRVDWRKWYEGTKRFVIHTNGRARAFRNTFYASQLLKDALCDVLREETGERPSVDTQDPEVAFQLFLEEGRATLYFDTSLQPLFKRGWRVATGPAPMQETLAAALLRLAGFNGSQALYDPCCGSGTILMEAALMATHTPSGFYRTTWGFRTLPDHDEAKWVAFKEKADAARTPLEKGRIWGCDIDAQAICAAKLNAKATGLAVGLTHMDCRSFMSPAFDLVVTNPPHGGRLQKQPHLLPAFRSFQKPAYVFSPESYTAKAIPLTASGEAYFLNPLNI